MSSPERIEGFAAIADYAVLGDGRTVALLASDGSVDWWPFPVLDSPPFCYALLEPGGGRFRLAPQGAYKATRRYLEGTNVLETTCTTPTGAVRLTQALNTGSAGRLPWTELAHRVEGLSGKVVMAWEFTLGDGFGVAKPWVTRRGETPVITAGDQSVAVVLDAADGLTVDPRAVSGTFSVDADRRVAMALVATRGEPLFVPSVAAVDARLDRTIESWRRWSAQVDNEGPWSGAVERSALALKALLAEADGAIAAAATTSLPERVGGPKNWDYRYAWVRDSSFAVDALINLGLHEEVHGAVSWLLGALGRNGPDLCVFYTLGGQVPDAETEADVSGYRHSRPVRIGNSASAQVQLGNYGDFFDTIHRYVGEGHLLDTETAQALAGLADRCCDAWMERDSGIWELHRLEHYTISKIGCWVALDRAVRLARSGQIPDRHIERWASEVQEIRDWVDTHCWCEAKGTYTFYAGTDQLDAAVLLAGRTGFDRGPRLASTVEAVAAELGRGPLLYRYSGMEEEEGAFVACTFWMVDALVITGQVARARRLMDEAITYASDLGLISEQVDPETRALLGNFPQGLSHLALINAAHSLRRVGRP